jgi:anion-transporting  ArsA/GET3 family ATPase
MTSVFDRELLVVTGKGGVGKTTLASALGLVAAERGLRTIVVEVGEQSRLPLLFGMPAPDPGDAAELEENLSSMSIDLDRALLEWLQSLGGRVSGRVLASSSTFQYFAAAAPGAKELVSMVKIWELTQGRRRRGRARSGGYDLVVLDAPATGHALGMLDSPRTFGAIARVGPIAGQAERLRELLADPDRSSYLGKQLGRELHAVIVNGMLPQRFSAAELRQITTLGDLPTRSTATRSAIAAAQAISERARFQHNQLARLRRRHFEVIGVPFQFTAELDLDAVRHIAEQLKRKL